MARQPLGGRFVAAFRQGLIETGYIEGQNVAIEYRFAEGDYNRLPAMAADLVHRRVSVIAATTTPAALAAKAATTTIPVVFTTTGDPVQMGLVASLSRPGGNITGVTRLNVEIAPKLLELMHELVPTATRIALLVNPTGPNAETLLKEIEAAARMLGLEVPVLDATTERDFDKVFSTFAQLSAGALVIGTDPFFTTRSQQLAALTLRGGVPATPREHSPPRAGLCVTAAASRMCTVWLEPTPREFLGARSPPISRSSSPLRSSWSSISRPQRRSASHSRSRYSAAPTR